MRLVRVAAGALNQTPLAWDENRRNILDAIEAARSEDVSILCLPELCITGYGCEDAFHSAGTAAIAQQVLGEIVPATKGLIVSVGLPVMHRNALYNAACLLVDGAIAGFVAKRYLAGDGIHYEPRWFKPWPEDVQVTVEIGGSEYPFGDLYFDCGGIRIGFEICEDAWVAKRPGAALALKGVDVILNPSASHFSFGKLETRKRFVIEGSRAFGLSYVYANLLGNESGRAIYDGGALIASAGRLAAAGPRFSYADFGITAATIDIDATRTAQARSGSYRPEPTEDTSDRVEVPFSFPDVTPRSGAIEQAPWESSGSLKEEELARSVSLALFDYLRKTSCSGFVISLSGGADSSACACLVALMVELGVAELGLDRFLAKLRMTGTARGELMTKLLACIYQGTKNSSETTRRAAEELSRSIGATYMEIQVDPLVDGYLAMLQPVIGRTLSWDTDDIALQNIQARVRAPSAWLVANVRSSLLLVTSNRSEAAVGYATMDGDTAGALMPIGGIDKAFLRRWLRWLELQGVDGVLRFPALSFVNAQQPTAELRPAERVQTDETDLMPYPILDAIERAFILDRQSPTEILMRLQVSHPEHSITQIGAWIERFFKLWCRNQWKRERYAPSFHLDDESLDPKTWCRFPILSGGYRRELQAMNDHIAARAAGTTATS